jgi:O-antigen/teichoic acid export membrane protein
VADELRQAADEIEAAGARAAKNTAVRAAGEIVGKLGSLVLFAFLAREVGAAGVGVYVFAFAWAEVAMAPVGLGIDRYMLRRIAGDKSTLDLFFWNALYLKVARGVPLALLSIALVLALQLGSEKAWSVAIILVGVLLETFARTYISTFNAFERGELAAGAITTQRIVAAALGLAALAAGYGVVGVAVAFTTGAAVQLALAHTLLVMKVRRPAGVLPRDARLELRRRSLPFLAEDIFGLVLARIDVLLLSVLATSVVVGIYGSAYRLIDSTTFIVVALSGAFTAMYTYLGPDTIPSLRSVFQRSLKLAIALLLPIAVAFAVVAEPLCRAFFGDGLASAADPLRLLAPVVVMFGVIVMCTNLVVSRSDPMRVVRVVAVVAAVNLILNLALIPPFDEEGAAIAMLASEIVYVLLALRIAVPLAGGVDWLRTLGAPAVAGAVMALTMLPVSGSLAPALAVGSAAYLAAFVAVESVVDPGDLRFVGKLLKRRLPGRARAQARAA